MPSSRKEIQINLRVPSDMAELIDQEAKRTRTNRSWVIREALHNYFESVNSDDGEYEVEEG
jgi:predicted transcriptional regulator